MTVATAGLAGGAGWLPPIHLHSLVPAHGALGIVLEVVGFLALLLAALGLVLLSEQDGLGRRRKLAWAGVILLVPVLGPAIYLHRRPEGI